MGVRAGDTFLGHPGQLQAPTHHLWIAVHVYEPEFDTVAYAVMVSVTSWIPNADPACELHPGEHPYLAHRSFIFYRGAIEVPIADLENMPRKAPASAALLTRLRQGLHASKLAPKRFKTLVPRQ